MNETVIISLKERRAVGPCVLHLVLTVKSGNILNTLHVNFYNKSWKDTKYKNKNTKTINKTYLI